MSLWSHFRKMDSSLRIPWVHRISGKHLVVAMLIGLTSRSVDPEASGSPAQDDGTDAATTHLQVQVRAKEGSPLMLSDQVIQGLRSQFWRKLGEHLLDRMGHGGTKRGLLWSYQSPPRLSWLDPM